MPGLGRGVSMPAAQTAYTDVAVIFEKDQKKEPPLSRYHTADSITLLCNVVIHQLLLCFLLHQFPQHCVEEFLSIPSDLGCSFRSYVGDFYMA